MGYYIIFTKTIYWKVFQDLVKAKRDEAIHRKRFEGVPFTEKDRKYWKEREEKGVSANLKWICDAMERRGFDLIFLTEHKAIFKKRTWLQNLARKLGLR